MRALLLPPIAALLPGLAVAACNADNCLRGIRNTQRPGVQDCNSYFLTTVTPAVSTVTATEVETETVTPTVYYDVTESRFISVTATVTDPRTHTSFITTVTQSVNSVIGVAKRQETQIPSLIPAYASACSGAVRYSSACSCLGASAMTVTAQAPTVIVTQTDLVTVSPLTVSLPTTVATEHITTTVSSATIVATVTTVGATATSTVTVPIPPACHNALASGRMYSYVDPNRSYAQKLGYEATFPAFTEEYRSQCCAWCHSVTDCTLWVFRMTNGKTSCFMSENYETINRKISAQCPRGIGTGGVYGPVNPNGVIGAGPCFSDP
ncbi:hypothetical protein B0I35DRAFT_480687 [Stachybotrys elegans]|uniref:Apple domain-containing protein n=1 Tax=Stachybotrys elegans TaxID=80388 RepID=A0A8K0WN75_9HYPO|nr:hypothetical protein B0I35DRAFT_480687 [Stachybotrys elegans]